MTRNTTARALATRRFSAPRRAALLATAFALAACASTPEADEAAPPERSLRDEIVYHLLIDRFENADPSNDQGGMTGDRSAHGFDPGHPAYFHGGDFRGVTERLDYIQGLGATSVLIGPITRGLPVARVGGLTEGGYHGEWPTHLDEVDPHFGTAEELAALVEAAHLRGLRVVLDIVVNATADLNAYEECGAGPCPYRSEASYPYTTDGPALGEPINQGYRGATDPEGFAALTRPDWAYSPIVPEGARSPVWLNEPTHYHQRGDVSARGEGYTQGDVEGLDDLFTEHPVVAEGLATVYGEWIRRTGADGARIRSGDRVTGSLWRALLPSIRAAAAGRGQTAPLIWARADEASRAAQARLLSSGLPAVQDGAVSQALRATVAGAATPQDLARALEGDAFYPGGHLTARRLPIALSDPDGRLGRAIREARPRSQDAERLARMRLGHALLMTLRGVPILYYGDEQGFGGSGDAARQDMLASRVPSYLDDDLIGTKARLSQANFDTAHPLYEAIGELARVRRRLGALGTGRQVTRLAEDRRDGLFAFSRIDDETGEEVLVVANLGGARREVFVPIEPGSSDWQSVYGYCASTTAAQGSYPVSVPSLDVVICRSGGA